MYAELELQKLLAIDNAQKDLLGVVSELKEKGIKIKKFNLKTDLPLFCGYEIFLDKETKLTSFPKSCCIEVEQDKETREIFIKISVEKVMYQFADKKFSSPLDKDFEKYWKKWSDLTNSSINTLYEWNKSLSSKKIK